MIYRLIYFYSFFLLACGQPTQISYNSPSSGSNLSFNGLLYANTCNPGETAIVYDNRQYLKGSKTTSQFDQLILDISNNQLESQMLSDLGCQRVFPIEFNGEFEQEVNVLSNGGQEQQNVIQVYQFRIPAQ
tara:strand:- start:74854 stop:75246 length:393 start_codon:yes stop_codon:yes gene_type:complete